MAVTAPAAAWAPARPAGAGDGRRADIQGLRALAVLLVILNHSGMAGFSGGYLGVDVFFVISGYVITQLLLREAPKGVRLGLSDFYARRIRRLAPAATATLVATVLAGYVLIGPTLNPNLPGDVRWASLFGANFRLIHTGASYFVPGLHPSLVTQYWSLAVEEQFYLLYPLVVFGLGQMVPAHRRVPALRLAVVAGMVLSAWWSAHISAGQPVTAYYSPATRFWELGLGCLLATCSIRRPARTVRAERLAVAAGAILLVVAMVRLGPDSVYPGELAWLPCSASALLIWAGRGGARTPVTRLLSVRPLRYIGDISYSLYLTHYVWLKLPEQLGHPLTGWAWRTVEIAGTFATSAVLYHLLENPIRRSRRLAGDRVAAWLVLAVCVAASWAAATYVGARLVG